MATDVKVRQLRNNGNTECTLCSVSLSHSHLVRAYINFEGDLTQVTGFVCCTCISRISSAQVPSPYENEAGANAIKESAPVPFIPRIDWGDYNSLVYFKKLTDSADKVNKSGQALENRIKRNTVAQEKAW